MDKAHDFIIVFVVIVACMLSLGVIKIDGYDPNAEVVVEEVSSEIIDTEVSDGSWEDLSAAELEGTQYFWDDKTLYIITEDSVQILEPGSKEGDSE